MKIHLDLRQGRISEVIEEMGAPQMQFESGLHKSQEVVEGLRIKLEPAPVMKRTLAAMIDMAIVGTVSYFMMIPFAIFFGATLAADVGLGGKGVFTIVLLVVYLIAALGAMHYYYIHFESKSGATPGKKLLGLKVISVDGKKLTKGQAVYREMVKWYLDAIFFIPAAISMMVTSRRQRVGDVLAKTMVVYSKSREESEQFIYVKQEDYRAIMAHLKVPELPKDVRQSYLVAANRAFLLNEQYALAAEMEQWNKYFRGLLGGQAESLGLNDTTVLRFMAEHCFQTDRRENEQKGWKNG